MVEDYSRACQREREERRKKEEKKPRKKLGTSWFAHYLVVVIRPPDGVDETKIGQGKFDGVRAAEGDEVVGRETRQKPIVVGPDPGRAESLCGQVQRVLDQVAGRSGLEVAFGQPM